MEEHLTAFITFICAHAHEAYWIFFVMLLLAGFNIPFSEDVILLVAGGIAATCIPEHWFKLFFFVWLGCYLSAWEAYWVGRILGPKLYNVRWFNRIITKPRIEKINHYYEKFGIFTFIVGRFCPGGVRNALFMTAGLGEMPFLKFILRDGLACLISSNVLFHIGYQFGENHDLLFHYFHVYRDVVLSILAVIGIVAILFVMFRKKKESSA